MNDDPFLVELSVEANSIFSLPGVAFLVVLIVVAGFLCVRRPDGNPLSFGLDTAFLAAVVFAFGLLGGYLMNSHASNREVVSAVETELGAALGERSGYACMNARGAEREKEIETSWVTHEGGMTHHGVVTVSSPARGGCEVTVEAA